jgi:hypothetical protein
VVGLSPWEKLLEHPRSREHFVQLYEADETALTKTVGHYMWEGLRRGEGVVVIVTPEHREIFTEHLEYLGANVTALITSRRLVFQDANETLTQFMISGKPDWPRFEKIVKRAMRAVKPAPRAEGLRAYGEMVGILWKARQFSAAIRLEQLWNKLLEQSNFSLYCAYAIDVFGTEFGGANLDGILCTHTHLVPAQPDGTLENALNLAMDETLGSSGAQEVRGLMNSKRPAEWAVLPAAEAMVLWLRRHLPEKADAIVQRARTYYQSAGQPTGAPMAREVAA